jgi:hypothetical protein
MLHSRLQLVLVAAALAASAAVSAQVPREWGCTAAVADRFETLVQMCCCSRFQRGVWHVMCHDMQSMDKQTLV